MAVSMPVEKIHEAEAMLEKAKALEQGSIADYNRFAIECAVHVLHVAEDERQRDDIRFGGNRTNRAEVEVADLDAADAQLLDGIRL